MITKKNQVGGNNMQNREEGFSLIEVVASLVLVSIVLISFVQIFIQSNKTAVDNTEKIVVINLADAQLERLKIDSSILEGVKSLPKGSNKTYTMEAIKLNNKVYSVQVIASVTQEEYERKLINIVVTVSAPNNKTKSSIEGYIKR